MSLLHKDKKFKSFYFPVLATLEGALQDYRIMAAEEFDEWYECNHTKYVPVDIHKPRTPEPLHLACYKFVSSKRTEMFETDEYGNIREVV